MLDGNEYAVVVGDLDDTYGITTMDILSITDNLLSLSSDGPEYNSTDGTYVVYDAYHDSGNTSISLCL